MSHRFLAVIRAVAVVVAVMSLASVPVTGQAPSAKTWSPPRTPDGQPDLQGIWNYATITPLERPSELAGKQILTDQEVAQLEEQAAQRRVDRAPREGDTGTYNQFWFDRGTKVIGTKRSSLVVDPVDGRIPPLTPAAQKKADALAAARQRLPAGPEDRDPSDRCINWGTAGPPMVPGPYNNNFQLLQSPGYVVILNEMVHDARIVPLDGRPHVGRDISQWMGDSRGRWEGNTLVVDTTNFTDKTNFRGSGESLHLVERFTRVDAGTLLYEFTVDDSKSFTRSWTAQVPMTKTQDLIYEYACHEGNYSIVGILGGARAQEKAAEEAAKKGSR